MDNLEQENPEQNPPVESSEQTSPEAQEEERLYAGRFKTDTELEEGYKQSSQEGIRLAQEVKTLREQLSQPKQKEVIQDKLDDLSGYFDADTAKVISGYTERKIQAALNQYTEKSQAEVSFTTQVTESWDETKKIYPEAADPNSKLYQLADKILFEKGLAVRENGTVKLMTPFAYRIAVDSAWAELGRQAPEDGKLKTKKNQATALGGRGSRSAGGGKMTYDQYRAMSDDEKDAYDRQTVQV